METSDERQHTYRIRSRLTDGTSSWLLSVPRAAGGVPAEPAPCTTHHSPVPRSPPSVGGERIEEKVARRRPRAAGGAGSLHHSPLTRSPLTIHAGGRQPAGAMYAAFKIFNPTADIGFDLAREYSAAEQMARDRNRS